MSTTDDNGKVLGKRRAFYHRADLASAGAGRALAFRVPVDKLRVAAVLHLFRQTLVKDTSMAIERSKAPCWVGG